MDDLVFVPSNPSGGLGHGGGEVFASCLSLVGYLLFIGDNGANSETAQLLGKFLGDEDLRRC